MHSVRETVHCNYRVNAADLIAYGDLKTTILKMQTQLRNTSLHWNHGNVKIKNLQGARFN